MASDPGKCIDDELLNRLFGLDLDRTKDPSQRTECGCIVSKDIGMYNSCPFGCPVLLCHEQLRHGALHASAGTMSNATSLFGPTPEKTVMTSEDAIADGRILIRHAHADWTPDEAAPLSARGRSDAAALAERLAQSRSPPSTAVPPHVRARPWNPSPRRSRLSIHIVDDLRERELSGEPVDDFPGAVRAHVG